MDSVNKDKYIGCMEGGAIGDALGAPIEFLNLKEIRTRYGEKGIQDYVEYEGPKGAFTDDTQMTLFTAEALLQGEHSRLVIGIEKTLHTLAHHSYLRWLHTQNILVKTPPDNADSFDIGKGWLIKEKILNQQRGPGNTVVNALSSGKAGTVKQPINNSKGCGTVMRIAPVGLVFYGRRKKAFTVACDFAAITHGHPTGYLSAGFLAALISDLAIQIPLKEAISNARKILIKWKNFEETDHAIEQALEMARDIKSKKQKPKAEDIEKLGQGWIAEEAIAMALLASLNYENDFKSGVLFAINHSGDSDSIGAITGNILGLINGLDKIPIKWLQQLIAQNIVKEMGEDLHRVVKSKENNMKVDWLKKYGD
jgi:ADP-ribosylglycohydrolase